MGKDLSKYRFEKAGECLEDAKLLLGAEKFASAANRSYYAVFHGMRSVLALEDKDYKKHSAVISSFRKDYIKAGAFTDKLSDIITVLFRVRTKSDYDDFAVISKKEVTEQVDSAEYFLQQIKAYLGAQGVK